MTSRPPNRLVTRVLPAAAALLSGLVVLTALGLLVHDRGDNRFDHAVFVRIQTHVPERVRTAVLHLADPRLIVALFVCLVVWATLRRRWDAAALAVVVPLTNVLLTEYVLKPWVHRTDNGYLAFPSGHEAGVASFACVAALLLLGSRISRGAKVLALLVLAVHVVAAAVGLVGGDYHYASDTVGSLALCSAVTVAVALLIDRIGRERPPGVHPEVRNETSGRATV